MKHFIPGLFFINRRAAASELAQALLQELRSFVGSSRSYTLQPIREPQTAADATQKFFVRSAQAVHFVLILSSSVSPRLVFRNVECMRMAKSCLSSRPGSVIELPVAEGTYAGRSYALWRMRAPLSSNRVAFAIQKRLIGTLMVRWLCDVASETLHNGDARQFAAFLERLLSVTGLQNAIKASAQTCRRAFLSGRIAPFSVLQHGDLWIGNVLKAPTKTGFTIIDWAGATFDGFPFYDLIKFGCSIGASAESTRESVKRYGSAIRCDSAMALPYVLAGLGRLHAELEHFPEDRFIALCEQKFNAIQAALH